MTATRPAEAGPGGDRELRAEIEALESELREARAVEACRGDVLRSQVSALVRRRDIVAAHVAQLQSRRAELLEALRAEEKTLAGFRGHRLRTLWSSLGGVPLALLVLLGAVGLTTLLVAKPQSPRAPPAMTAPGPGRNSARLTRDNVEVLLDASEDQDLWVRQIEIRDEQSQLVQRLNPSKAEQREVPHGKVFTFPLLRPLEPGRYGTVLEVGARDEASTTMRLPLTRIE